MFEKYKTAIIAGVVILVIAVGGIIYASTRSTAPQATETTTEEELDEPIPTVDSSVQVELKTINNGQDVIVEVKNPPAGTEKIEGEITYDRQNPDTGEGSINDGGFLPDLEEEDGVWSGEVKLGTCSATCTYHTVVSDIKVNLLFTGDYGERIFEKAFPYSKDN